MIGEVLEKSGVAGLIGWEDQQKDEENILSKSLAAALYPFQLATTPTAIKIYLTVILFLTTSFILISISTTAFGIFYYNFIPQTDFERPIYLQYATDQYPSARVLLDTNVLISQQPYDISIVLHLPRDPVNLAAGNFMLDLSLHGNVDSMEATVLETLNMAGQKPTSTLHHSRRPALMPYASPVSDLVSRLVHLPLHVLSFHDSDSVTLIVPMFEEVEFARGRDNIPKLAILEIQTQQPPQPLLSQMHVYSAKLVFQVRFHGLRYLVYNYRTLAFMAFTALFYIISISTVALVWAVLATLFRSPENSLVKLERELKVKQESGQDVSDPLRTASDHKSDKTPRLGTDESDNDTVNLRENWNASGALYTPQTSDPASAVSQDPAVAPEAVEGAPEEHADDEEEESEDEWQQLERLRRKMDQDARQRQLQMQQQDSGLGTSLESENAVTARSGITRRTSSGKKT